MLTFILALACGEKPDDTHDSTPPIDSADSDPQDSDPQGNPCEPEDVTVDKTGIHGNVTTTSGDPVACMRTQFCNNTCAVGTSNGSGEYSIGTNENGLGALEFFPLSDDYADFFVTAIPYETESGADYNVDIVLQQSAGWQDMPATSTEVDMGDGLTLTLGADLVELPFGTDENTVGAKAVPEAEWPPLIGLDHGGTVVAIYYLSPFDAHAGGDGLDFWISNSAIQETKVYTVYEFQVDTTEFIYEWANLGTSTAEGGVGGKLHYLSMLVVVEEPVEEEK